MQDEIELKLQAPPAKIRKVLASGFVRNIKTGRSRNERLVSTYYDTPRHTLRRAGISLRVRQDKRGFEQTVKAPAAGPAGLQTYREWSGRISGGAPCIEVIDDGEIRAVLKYGNRHKRLSPVFTTDVQRQTVPIGFGGSGIELAFDLGRIHAPNGNAEDISEIELELESGDHPALFELALELVESGGLALGNLTKAERGYALARPALRSGAQRADKPPLAVQMSVSEAFHAVMQDTLSHLRANERPVAEGDPEGVHQARVAIRRLRAALAAFRDTLKGKKKRKRFNREFRWFQAQLSPARDWHVFAVEMLPVIQAACPGEKAAIARLRSIARTEQARAAAHMAGLFESPRYARLILEFTRWLDQQAETINASVSGQSLTAYAARVLDSTRAGFLVDTRPLSRMSAEDRHALRKRGKKARYACEFFAALWPGRQTETYLGTMKRLQEALGEINDFSVAGQLQLLTGPGVLDESTENLLQSLSLEAIRGLNRKAQPTWRRYQGLQAFWHGKPQAPGK